MLTQLAQPSLGGTFTNHDPLQTQFMTGGMEYAPDSQFMTSSDYGAFRSMPSMNTNVPAQQDRSLWQAYLQKSQGKIPGLPSFLRYDMYNPFMNQAHQQVMAHRSYEDKMGGIQRGLGSLGVNAAKIGAGFAVGGPLGIGIAAASMLVPDVFGSLSERNAQARQYQNASMSKIVSGSDMSLTLGKGLSKTASMKMVADMRRQAADDDIFSIEDYMLINKISMKTGMHDFSSSSKQFSDVNKKLIKNFEFLAKAYEETDFTKLGDIVQRMQRMGADINTQRYLGDQESMFSRAMGIKHQQLTDTYGQQGAMMFTREGLTGYQGSLANISNAAMVTMMQRTGGISASQLSRAGGVSGMSQRMTEGKLAIDKKMENLRLAYAMNEDGSGLDASKVKELTKGVTLETLTQVAAQRMRDPEMYKKLLENKQDLTHEMREKAGITGMDAMTITAALDLAKHHNTDGGKLTKSDLMASLMLLNGGNADSARDIMRSFTNTKGIEAMRTQQEHQRRELIHNEEARMRKRNRWWEKINRSFSKGVANLSENTIGAWARETSIEEDAREEENMGIHKTNVYKQTQGIFYGGVEEGATPKTVEDFEEDLRLTQKEFNRRNLDSEKDGIGPWGADGKKGVKNYKNRKKTYKDNLIEDILPEHKKKMQEKKDADDVVRQEILDKYTTTLTGDTTQIESRKIEEKYDAQIKELDVDKIRTTYNERIQDAGKKERKKLIKLKQRTLLTMPKGKERSLLAKEFDKKIAAAGEEERKKLTEEATKKIAETLEKKGKLQEEKEKELSSVKKQSVYSLEKQKIENEYEDKIKQLDPTKIEDDYKDKIENAVHQEKQSLFWQKTKKMLTTEGPERDRIRKEFDKKIETAGVEKRKALTIEKDQKIRKAIEQKTILQKQKDSDLALVNTLSEAAIVGEETYEGIKDAYNHNKEMKELQTKLDKVGETSTEGKKIQQELTTKKADFEKRKKDRGALSTQEIKELHESRDKELFLAPFKDKELGKKLHKENIELESAIETLETKKVDLKKELRSIDTSKEGGKEKASEIESELDKIGKTILSHKQEISKNKNTPYTLEDQASKELEIVNEKMKKFIIEQGSTSDKRDLFNKRVSELNEEKRKAFKIIDDSSSSEAKKKVLKQKIEAEHNEELSELTNTIDRQLPEVGLKHEGTFFQPATIYDKIEIFDEYRLRKRGETVKEIEGTTALSEAEEEESNKVAESLGMDRWVINKFAENINKHDLTTDGTFIRKLRKSAGNSFTEVEGRKALGNKSFLKMLQRRIKEAGSEGYKEAVFETREKDFEDQVGTTDSLKKLGKDLKGDIGELTEQSIWGFGKSGMFRFDDTSQTEALSEGLSKSKDIAEYLKVGSALKTIQANAGGKESYRVSQGGTSTRDAKAIATKAMKKLGFTNKQIADELEGKGTRFKELKSEFNKEGHEVEEYDEIMEYQSDNDLSKFGAKLDKVTTEKGALQVKQGRLALRQKISKIVGAENVDKYYEDKDYRKTFLEKATGVDKTFLERMEKYVGTDGQINRRYAVKKEKEMGGLSEEVTLDKSDTILQDISPKVVELVEKSTENIANLNAFLSILNDNMQLNSDRSAGTLNKLEHAINANTKMSNSTLSFLKQKDIETISMNRSQGRR